MMKNLTVVLALLPLVNFAPAQEAKPDKLFRVVIEAAVEEAGFRDARARGQPIIVDYSTFRQAGVPVPGRFDEARLEAVGTLRNVPFAEAQRCDGEARWKCTIVDGGLHREVVSFDDRGIEADVRIRSRRYVANGSVAGICPRELVLTLRRVGAGC